jgi:hypothetical protein
MSLAMVPHMDRLAGDENHPASDDAFLGRYLACSGHSEHHGPRFSAQSKKVTNT